MKILKSSAMFSVIIGVLVVIASVSPALAAIMTFETQYEYEEINKAWLTDLQIKESLTTVGDMVASVSLTAEPDYPYTETPESFMKDVQDTCNLYYLDENSARAAYIYLFDFMNQNSNLIEDGTSDEDIKAYLTERGIRYPDNMDGDTLVMARALYVFMSNGALDPYLTDGTLPSGTSIESAVVNYMSVITGVDMTAVKEWTTVEDDLSLDDYIVATSKYMLWSNGYDVSIDMTDAEVFRMMALMTINKQGVSASSDLSFNEIKMRYLSVMLSENYDVSCNVEELGIAYANNEVPYYILQLIGQDVGLSIQPDAYNFNDAFMLVAEQSDRFDLDDTEFYADIYNYSAVLQYKRSSIWLYPTSYVCYNKNNTGNMISITANGKSIQDGNFNEIQLNTAASEETIVLELVYTFLGEYYKTTYNIHITQGLLPPDTILVDKPDIEDVLNGNLDLEQNKDFFADGYVANTGSVIGSLIDSMEFGFTFDQMLNSGGTIVSAPSFSTGSIVFPTIDTNFSLIDSITANGNAITGINPPSLNTSDLNIDLSKPTTSISLSSMAQQLINSVPKTEGGDSTILSGIGGLEFFSVAEDMTALLLTAGVVSGNAAGNAANSAADAVVDTAKPMVGTAVNDLLFDKGKESVIGVSLDNDINSNMQDASNIAYISNITNNTVSAYSSTSNNEQINNYSLSEYLSQQPVVNADLNSSIADIQNNRNNSRQYLKYIMMGALAAFSALIVIVIIFKQRNPVFE